MVGGWNRLRTELSVKLQNQAEQKINKVFQIDFYFPDKLNPIPYGGGGTVGEHIAPISSRGSTPYKSNCFAGTIPIFASIAGGILTCLKKEHVSSSTSTTWLHEAACITINYCYG